MKSKVLRIGLVPVVLIAALMLVPLTGTQATAATPVEIEDSIVAGLAWLAAQQSGDGSWGSAVCDRVGATGLAVLKFIDRGKELAEEDPQIDGPFDPDYLYNQEVIDGLAYIVANSHEVDISGEPSCDGGGLLNEGLRFNDCTGHDTYNTAIATMALSAALSAGGAYGDLAQDGLDWLCFAQNNSGCGDNEGGWGYGANDCGWADNSNSGYAALGVGFAEASGLTVPQSLKDVLSLWIDYAQDDVDNVPPVGDDGGGTYDGPGSSWINILQTGNLLQQMALVGDTLPVQRVKDAVDYIERHWCDVGGTPGGGISSDTFNEGWLHHRQAMFTMMKGLESQGIEELDVDCIAVPDPAYDWFDEVSTHLVNTQLGDGSWPIDPWEAWQFFTPPYVLSTAWALLTLEKVAPPPEPPEEECVFCPWCFPCDMCCGCCGWSGFGAFSWR